MSQNHNKDSHEVAKLGAKLFDMVLNSNSSDTTTSHVRKNWMAVANHALQREDPWEDLAHNCFLERAVEHVYNAKRGKWIRRTILVKIDMDHAAGKGAMRECFRIKMKNQPSTVDINWLEMCETPVTELFNGVGRKTALRIRTAMGLPQVSIHHPRILTVGELFHFAKDKGVEAVFNILEEECHSWNDQDQFLALVRANDKEIAGWCQASLNCMAKRYMDPAVGEDTYREDIIMQATSKLLCDKFNKLRPPKSIDMLHVGLIQLIDRADQPLLGYESFIAGKYIKWNTNTGWVEDKVIRHTPQAFSFASFRISGGKLMVVDIQGVDDLYTDPQIHSIDGKEFGNGNLGPRGMALFLRSFRYELNPIVSYLKLAPFAMASGELAPLDDDDQLVVKAKEGEEYLASAEWHHRRMNRSYSNSSTNSDDPEAEMDPIAEMLLDLSKTLIPLECPATAEAIVPNTPSTESHVHFALAVLYDEEDERVMSELGACTSAEASTFHYWMAALGGNVEAMQKCAELSCNRPKRAFDWLGLAAKRGSQDACMEALENHVNKEDHIMKVFYLQLALENAPESDLEQRKLMKICRYEIHEKLAQEFQQMSELENAKKHYEAAAELCIEMNLFHLNAKFTELAGSLRN